MSPKKTKIDCMIAALALSKELDLSKTELLFTLAVMRVAATERREARVQDITEITGITPAQVRGFLKLLRSKRIITTRTPGRVIHMRPTEKAARLMEAFRV